jgi:phosphotransferase system HPr (HPr) family protein
MPPERPSHRRLGRAEGLLQNPPGIGPPGLNLTPVGFVGRSPLDRAGRLRPAAGRGARAGAPALPHFAGDIWLSHGDARSSRCANGKSILSLMLLGATPGTEITIEARGEDEAEALNALAELITGRFGEEPH